MRFFRYFSAILFITITKRELDILSHSAFRLFSRDEATLYEGVSVRRSVRRMVRPSVTSYFFGLLGATNAVYTALFYHTFLYPFFFEIALLRCI